MVPSPGVRPQHPAFVAAIAAGIPIRGDIDLGMEAARVPVVAVTGTNGKSTVTTLITAILNASGVRAEAAGNIGRPLLDVVEEPWDVIVAEISSFQLHTTTAAFRPKVAVLLNVAEDHIDWHGSFAEYTAVKARVFEHQRDDDLLVANLDDPIVARARRGRAGPDGRGGDRRRRGATYTAGPRIPPEPNGRRDRRGRGVAVADAPRPHQRTGCHRGRRSRWVAVWTQRATSLREFPRLHHRVEPVGKASGVEYFDDSKATNPHATLSALAGFERVVLLAGGDSKGVDLGALARAKDRTWLPWSRSGTRPDEVERALGDIVPTVRAGSMARGGRRRGRARAAGRHGAPVARLRVVRLVRQLRAAR